MRRSVALSLVLLVPIGLLITMRGPTDFILRTWQREGTETSRTWKEPAVRVAFRESSAPEDPLICPIVRAAPTDTLPPTPLLDFTHGDRAVFHPHGERICASGCAASRHPTETLTSERFNSLLLDYASDPIAEPGPAQDALLYYGRQAARRLATVGSGRLDPLRTTILKRELARHHAEIEIRVVDARDGVRAALPTTSVPLDRRHEFELDTHDLQPMIASGTVKRVGRDYLWTRL